MKQGHWQIQEAKQRFSELVKSARVDGPQEITFRGEGCAWIISSEDYERLTKPKSGLIEFFQNSPCREVNLKIKRNKDLPRDIEL